jgi:hypothetical protein
MRRWLVLIAGVATLAVTTAGAASATVTYDPLSDHGFIGRGDVIANAGKAALVAEPLVSFTRQWDATVSCEWQDGTRQQATATLSYFILQQAVPRYAPGSGAITGYSLVRLIVDGMIPLPGWDVGACYAATGGADHGSLVGNPTFVSASAFRDVLGYSWYVELPGGGRSWFSVDLPFTTP